MNAVRTTASNTWLLTLLFATQAVFLGFLLANAWSADDPGARAGDYRIALSWFVRLGWFLAILLNAAGAIHGVLGLLRQSPGPAQRLWTSPAVVLSILASAVVIWTLVSARGTSTSEVPILMEIATVGGSLAAALQLVTVVLALLAGRQTAAPDTNAGEVA